MLIWFAAFDIEWGNMVIDYSYNNGHLPHCRNQATCQPSYIAPTPPPPPPMPAVTMGAKTSAPLPVATNLATFSVATGHVSMPPQEPISTVAAALPPTSFASYSAVPLPTPTLSTSSAFVPSMNPQLQQPQQQQYHQVPSNAVTAPSAFIDNAIGSTNMPNERFQPYRETVLTLFSFTRNQVRVINYYLWPISWTGINVPDFIRQ